MKSAQYMDGSKSLGIARQFLGKSVKLRFDQPIGSAYARFGIESYPVNYGYVPGVAAPDGDDLDAYYLGATTPLEEAEGICIAVVHRLDDDDDKLVVVPAGMAMTDEEIMEQVHFQERFFVSEVRRK